MERLHGSEDPIEMDKRRVSQALKRFMLAINESGQQLLGMKGKKSKRTDKRVDRHVEFLGECLAKRSPTERDGSRS